MAPDVASSTYRESLVQTGLTKDQAALYEALIKNGPQPASRAALLSGISRPLAYKVLDELIAIGLVEKKDEPKKVAVFAAAHPLTLKKVVDKRLEGAQSAKMALDSALGSLITQFNTMSGQPGVRILEGVAGVAELYEDILNERKPLLLIRSPLDESRPELGELVARQLRDQARLGIRVRALTPLVAETRESVQNMDASRLVDRRIIPLELLNIPAQIIIYAGKVALTAYEGELITTIVENPAISKTMEILFEYIWRAAAAEHAHIVGNILSGAAEDGRAS